MTNNYQKFTFTILLLLSMPLMAQPFRFYKSDSLTFLNSGNQPLSMAFTGGFHCPQISACDLNKDGKKDLVIYDKLDGSISTMINKGGMGQFKYELDNRYAQYFPKFKAFAWMLMRDFNNDGYEDIFTTGPQGYVVFKNLTASNSVPTFQELPTLIYRNMSPSGSFIEYNNLSTPSIHLPGIYDIDFDGDLDIMSYSNLGGAIYLFQNYQKELNLPPDSMRFFHVDMCWGYFNDYDCNSYLLNTCSKNSDYRLYGPRHTNGSSITLFDANNDNDIDLLIGNEGCSHMTMLYNAKPNNYMQYDSFYVYDTNYVSPSNRANVSIYPAAYFLDLDNDGKRDLAYAPNSISTSYIIEETNQIRWFKNTGIDKAPVFAQQTPLFTTDMLDLGNKSNWAAADWDRDGDNDLIAATNADAYKSKDTADRLYLFENVGTAKNAQFKLINTDFGQLFKDKVQKLYPTISDMDNDGKLDLVCGNDKGEILFYKNTSSSNNTLNPSFTYANSTYPGFNIDIGGFSAPAVADINGDGLKDLIIGRSDSMLSYYRNTGSLSSPNFSIYTNKFGMIKAFDSIGFQYVYDDTFAIIGYYPIYEKNTYSKPSIIDMNGDGILELLVCNSVGSVRLYEIDGNKPNSAFKQLDSCTYINGLNTQKFYNNDFGNFISGCLADFNGDTIPEILIAGNRGGLQFLKSNSIRYNHKNNLNELQVSQAIQVFPNPTQRHLEIPVAFNDVLQYEVINQIGQTMTLKLENFDAYSRIDVSELPSGFYIIHLRSSGNKQMHAKFQVIR